MKLKFLLSLLLPLVAVSAPIRDDLAAHHFTFPQEDAIVPIDYIESTGTQYINVSSAFYDFEIEAQTENPSSGNYLCGLSSSRSVRPTSQSNKCWVFYPGAFVSPIKAAERHKIAWIKDTIYCDEAVVGVATKPFHSGVFSIFGWGDNASKYGNRIYMFRLYDAQGEVLLDLIPVRLGNIGYMYDKLSGELFANQGTGDFLLGPDL